MGTVIGLLITRGWSEKAARAICYAGLAAIIVGALWAAKCAYDANVIHGYQQKQEQRAAPATQKASVQRDKDAATRAEKSKEMNDVIHSVPDQAINPVSQRRACLQLRRAGKSSAACDRLNPAR